MTPLWIGIGVGALVFVIITAVVVVLIMRCRNKWVWHIALEKCYKGFLCLQQVGLSYVMSSSFREVVDKNIAFCLCRSEPHLHSLFIFFRKKPNTQPSTSNTVPEGNENDGYEALDFNPYTSLNTTDQGEEYLEPRPVVPPGLPQVSAPGYSSFERASEISSFNPVPYQPRNWNHGNTTDSRQTGHGSDGAEDQIEMRPMSGVSGNASVLSYAQPYQHQRARRF